MITLITGVPGSGKSYYAVHELSRRKDKVKILHNIEGLKYGKTFDEYMSEKGFNNVLQIFSTDYHEKNDDLHGWLIVIDEAQQFFPKYFKDTSVVYFFDYHRHFGMDIILISQHEKKMCFDITALAVLHYHAVSDAGNPIPFCFLYQKKAGGEVVGKKFLFKKQSVFSMYKSTSDEGSSVSSVGKVYLVVLILVFVGLFYGFKFFFGRFAPERDSVASNPSADMGKLKEQLPQLVAPGPSPSGGISEYLGGRPVLLGVLKDYSGTYYVLCDLIIKSDIFPFSVVKGRLGVYALLPPDVFLWYAEYHDKLDSDLSGAEPQRRSGDSGVREGERGGQITGSIKTGN